MTVSWLDRMFGRGPKSFGAQRGDRIEENTAMADRRHAEVSEVLGSQLGQDGLIDRVFPECLLVAFQAEAAQPGRDIHGIHTHTWPHSFTGYSRRTAATLAVRRRSSRSRTKPSHQNEIASLLHPLERNTFFVKRWNL